MDEIARLAELYEKGLLTHEEFVHAKAKLLAESEPPPKKSGPNPTNMFATRLAILLGGGLLALVVLFSLYLLLFVDAPFDAPELSWPEPEIATQGRATLGISLRDLVSITQRCEGPRTRNLVGGKPRFMCTRESHPPFLLEAIGEDSDFSTVTIIQGMGGNPTELMEQLMNGAELFRLVAGAKVGEFMPEGWLLTVPTEETREVYDGRVYTTLPLPDMGGLMFSVSAEE